MNPTVIHDSRHAPYLDSTYSWTRLAVSVFVATIGGVGLWSVVVVLPDVQSEFGIDRADASLPYTMTMLGFAVGNVVIGRFIDRMGFMFPALVAAAMLGAGFILAALTTSVFQFAVIQALLIGVGASTTFGPLIADISHWFDRRRGVAVAAAACGNYLAGALWPLGMQDFIPFYGWRATYIGIGVICLVTMIPLLLFLKRKVPVEAHGFSSAGSMRPVQAIGVSPAVLQGLLIVAGLGCCVAMSMPQVHIVAYCMDLGYGVARGTEMLALMLAGGIVSRIGSGFLADRIGGIRTVIIGSVLQCVSLFFYIPFDGLASLYVVSLIFGLSQGGIVPCYAIIVREYMPAAEAGQRVGVVIMATIVGMAIGGWMSGWIYDLTGSYAAAFLNGIAWNLLNLVVMALLLWRSRIAQPARA
ncbi:MFS transporter [Mesorhizobium sp. CGMCC 1.15528]|uniref:MFS transporter n=1 Tax=Mesorhizobium zhangyense TaxID=1776730 RepID=A0A7C9V801_9HYPH|nr:MFS transporter [Mesorhizobium zhangyense]NGN40886.1 MFS transporter [Mesorhizobium zhangyense]